VAFVLAPFFLLAAAFLFVVVFVFAAAWFAHLVLAELAALRALEPAAGLTAAAAESTTP